MSDTRLAVEVGGDTMLTEDIKLYGEVEMVTGPQNDYGTKVGVKYFGADIIQKLGTADN